MTNGQNYDSDSVLCINNVKLLLLISERIVKGKSNKMSVERLWSRGYPLGSHQIANRSPCELPFRHFEFCHINVAIVLCHYTIVVVAAAVSAAVSFSIFHSLCIGDTVCCLLLTACSHRRHETKLSCLVRVSGVNKTADKTRQFCLVLTEFPISKSSQ